MANLITLARFPLLVLILGLLFWGDPRARLASVPLILILMLMDCVDGIVARRRHESSLLGSTLDIAADRAVEMVLWVTFSSLGIISVVIPLVVIIRGTLTDSIRAVASSHGMPAFKMMRSRWARFLVASPAMRTSYAIVKGIAFCTLALALALQSQTAGLSSHSPTLTAWLWTNRVAQAFSWLALALCLVRGIPVLVEAPRYFQSLDNRPAK